MCYTPLPSVFFNTNQRSKNLLKHSWYISFNLIYDNLFFGCCVPGEYFLKYDKCWLSCLQRYFSAIKAFYSWTTSIIFIRKWINCTLLFPPIYMIFLIRETSKCMLVLKKICPKYIVYCTFPDTIMYNLKIFSKHIIIILFSSKHF